MENYIVINGKKAELTEEQLIALGIKNEKNDPFKLELGDYFYINPNGEVIEDHYCSGCIVTKNRHNAANFCTDKDLMEQRALHEKLNRLLWRYSMEHDGDKIAYGDDTRKYHIYFNNGNIHYPEVNSWARSTSVGLIFFYNEKIAKAAIEEIVKPFMKEHPDFKW